MKRYLLLLLSCIYSLHVVAQPVQKLLEAVDGDIQNIQGLLKLSGTRIILSSEAKAFDPKDNFNFEQNKIRSITDTTLQTFFKQLTISGKLIYPYNVVGLYRDEFDLLAMLGYDNFYFSKNPGKAPAFTPVQFRFLDGTIVKAKGNYVNDSTIAKKHTKVMKEDGETYEYVDEDTMTPLEKLIWKSTSFQDNLAVLSSKPLHSISYQIALPLSKRSVYALDNKDRSAKTTYGTITIDTISGSQVYCRLPEMDNDYGIQIQAYYKDGRVLAQRGYSGNTIISDDKKELYRQYLTVLKAAKDEIKKETINTKEQLDTYLKSYAPKAVAAEEDNGRKYKSILYTFSGPVSRVDFLVTDSTEEVRTFDLSYSFAHSKSNENYFVATDFEKQQTGLINKQGKWVVQPQFDEYFRTQNSYFYWDQIDDRETTYWFDHKTETISKVPYRIDDPELYDNRYVKIEPHINGSIGLVDVITGKIVLPMEHDFLRFKENKWWLAKRNEKEGVYGKDLKLVLPFEFTDIDLDSNYFYVKQENKPNVYNSSGVNITQDKFSDIKGTYADGLLLVATREKQQQGSSSNSKYYYVDQMMQVKIDVQAKGFHSPEPFSGGMAIVEDEHSRRGYINTAGKLVIPFQFNYAHDFYPTSRLALVQLKDYSEVLIDQAGKVVKKFNIGISRRELKPEDRASRLYAKDGSVYNEYGEEVEKNK